MEARTSPLSDLSIHRLVIHASFQRQAHRAVVVEHNQSVAVVYPSFLPTVASLRPCDDGTIGKCPWQL